MGTYLLRWVLVEVAMGPSRGSIPSQGLCQLVGDDNVAERQFLLCTIHFDSSLPFSMWYCGYDTDSRSWHQPTCCTFTDHSADDCGHLQAQQKLPCVRRLRCALCACLSKQGANIYEKSRHRFYSHDCGFGNHHCERRRSPYVSVQIWCYAAATLLGGLWLCRKLRGSVLQGEEAAIGGATHC